MSPARPSPRKQGVHGVNAHHLVRNKDVAASGLLGKCVMTRGGGREVVGRGKDGQNWGQSRGPSAGRHSQALSRDDAHGDGNDDVIVGPWPLADGRVRSPAQTPTLEASYLLPVFLLWLLPALSAGTGSLVPAGTPGQKSADVPCLCAALRACAREGGRLPPKGHPSQCQTLSQRKHESSRREGVRSERQPPALGDIG